MSSADDMASLVEALGDRRSEHRLLAVLVDAAPGVVSRGRFYEALPPTAGKLLSSSAAGSTRARTRLSRLASVEIELDGPVEGGFAVRLRVDSGSPNGGSDR